MNYEPGTVAVATVESGCRAAQIRVTRFDGGWARADDPDIFWMDADNLVTDVRPVVVLDLDAAGMGGPQRIANYLRVCAPVVQRDGGGLYAGHLTRIADQIEQQTKPPKPEEPRGLGAVVIDSSGVRWVRTESAKGIMDPWQAALHVAEPDRVRSLPYADIDTVRVLSEGVVNG